ncbi:hypothetical protein ACLKA6_019292 [Drosophila palustris]
MSVTTTKLKVRATGAAMVTPKTRSALREGIALHHNSSPTPQALSTIPQKRLRLQESEMNSPINGYGADLQRKWNVIIFQSLDLKRSRCPTAAAQSQPPPPVAVITRTTTTMLAANDGDVFVSHC